jgi:hypothetical protein
VQERPDVVKKREEWVGGQLAFDPDKLIFIEQMLFPYRSRQLLNGNEGRGSGVVGLDTRTI